MRLNGREDPLRSAQSLRLLPKLDAGPPRCALSRSEKRIGCCLLRVGVRLAPYGARNLVQAEARRHGSQGPRKRVSFEGATYWSEVQSLPLDNGAALPS